jgi:lipopolysaccharide export system permease protein
MLTILDKYILKKYLTTFFFMLGVILLLAAVFDLSERLGDFIEREAPFQAIVFDYYFSFIIYFGNLFSPLITFVSVIWFTAKLAQNTEIIPMINSGRPFRRLLRPYMIGATILMLISLGMNHFVLPSTNEKKLKFEEKYYRNIRRVANFFAEYPDNSIVYFDSYRSDLDRVSGLVIEKRDENDSLINVLRAKQAFSSPESKEWRLKNFYVRHFGHPNDQLFVAPTNKEIDTILPYQISELVQRENVVMTMGYDEIKDFIELERKKGSANIAAYEIELYQRTSFPFANYVLTLIGMVIASRKKRGGVGVNIAAGLGLAFIYIFAMKVTAVAAQNVGFPSYLAVWIPNIIFGVLGLIIYRFTPK